MRFNIFLFKIAALFSIFLILPNYVTAQFPRLCATAESLRNGSCCPPLNGVGSSCGETEGRGKCDWIKIDNAPYGPPYDLVGIDDRERWPARFYNRSCVCNGNFGGFDCSGCKPGWEGGDCKKKKFLNIRRNIFDLNEEERIRFLDVLDQSKKTMHPDYMIAREHYRNLMGPNGTNKPDFVNVSIYDLFVWNHYYSVRDTLLGPGKAFTAIDFSHQGPGFLTWHRMHLLSLEMDLQKLIGDPTFSIPYWDFAKGGSECDICNDEYLGGRDPSNPNLISPKSKFSEWDVICLSLEWYDENIKLCNTTSLGSIQRNPGGNVDWPEVQKLPLPEDVKKCLHVEEYDTSPFYSTSNNSFRNTLEGYSNPNGHFDEGVRGLHNLAHLFLNGTGGITHASANDPIFVLLHSYTDALFDEWLTRTDPSLSEFPTENAPIGHNLHFNMVPFFPPVTNKEMFVPADTLGYSYAIRFPVSEPSQGSQVRSPPKSKKKFRSPWYLWLFVGICGGVILIGVIILVVILFRKMQNDDLMYRYLLEEDSLKGTKYSV